MADGDDDNKIADGIWLCDTLNHKNVITSMAGGVCHGWDTINSTYFFDDRGNRTRHPKTDKHFKDRYKLHKLLIPSEMM